MKLRLTAAFEGDAVLDKPLEMTNGNLSIGFRADDKGSVVEVWVEKRLAGDGPFPSFQLREGAPPLIQFPDPPETDELLTLLQYLESIGSFWLHARRIGWAEANIEWRPENDEEKARLTALAIRRRQSYDRQPMPLQARRVAMIMTHRPALEYLMVPMSFYREGMNEFDVHRYINSFFNFYFFLEGLYGGSKTKNRAVLASFQSSAQLRTGLERFRTTLTKPDMAPNLQGIQRFLAGEGCDDSVEGLLALLVSIRGKLHHYSIRSTQLTGHPLNHDEFRPMAYLAMGACHGVLPALLSGHPVG
jgi:hypothetical protein